MANNLKTENDYIAELFLETTKNGESLSSSEIQLIKNYASLQYKFDILSNNYELEKNNSTKLEEFKGYLRAAIKEKDTYQEELNTLKQQIKPPPTLEILSDNFPDGTRGLAQLGYGKIWPIEHRNNEWIYSDGIPIHHSFINNNYKFLIFDWKTPFEKPN